jgi:hypothetical protein
MTAPPRPLSALTEKTFFPLGMVTLALGAVAGGAWWLSAMYTNQVTFSAQVNSRLERIERQLSDSSAQMVTERDMRIWVMTLKNQNDGLKIPDWIH